MIQTKTIPIRLTAAKNHYLTQATEVDIVDRIVASTVTLAVNDTAGSWREITADEADAIRNEQAALIGSVNL